jgi:hypothetical protein
LKLNTPDSENIVTMWNQINDLYNTLRGSSSYSDIQPQKMYRASLHQGDANITQAITASVLFNNTGVTPTYSRSAAGSYVVSASGLFNTASRVRAVLPVPFQSGALSASFIYAGRSGSDDYGYIATYNTASTLVDQWSGVTFEVVVGHS